MCGGWEEVSEPEAGGPSGRRTHIACGHWCTHPRLADDQSLGAEVGFTLLTCCLQPLLRAGA